MVIASKRKSGISLTSGKGKVIRTGRIAKEKI